MELTRIHTETSYIFADTTLRQTWRVHWQRYASLSENESKAIPYIVRVEQWYESDHPQVPGGYLINVGPMEVHDKPTAMLSLKLLKPFIDENTETDQRGKAGSEARKKSME